jgi:hypothetical protein
MQSAVMLMLSDNAYAECYYANAECHYANAEFHNPYAVSLFLC